MKNNRNIVANLVIILIALCNAILNVIDGLSGKLNLFEFILCCSMILIGVIGIYKEMKWKRK